MSNLTIEINCPQLVELTKSMYVLAEAIKNQDGYIELNVPGQEIPVIQSAVTPSLNIPVTPVTPVQSIPVQSVPVQSVPVNQPVQQTIPTVQIPTTPIQTVPTAAPQYGFEQLASAAMPLVDAGKLPEVQGLLKQFGVNALQELPPEQYGNFATALRGLGAKI